MRKRYNFIKSSSNSLKHPHQHTIQTMPRVGQTTPRSQVGRLVTRDRVRGKVPWRGRRQSHWQGRAKSKNTTVACKSKTPRKSHVTIGCLEDIPAERSSAIQQGSPSENRQESALGLMQQREEEEAARLAAWTPGSGGASSALLAEYRR
jgi:hypothetical protein